MNNWNKYRTFEDFETAELWSSEIVTGALQSMDDEWSGFDDKVSFADDVDDADGEELDDLDHELQDGAESAGGSEPAEEPS